MTNHAWSGFNLIANLDYWRSLSGDAQDAIHRAARTHVARQRSYTMALNLDLQKKLRVERVPQAPFRARVAPALYARWKERCGTTAWRLLRDASGRLD
jgi:TRAP-type C4-dicarboxylate transport system substrate-binding protein